MGNPTARIFLSLRGMSTVKIRAGSLFCTPHARIGAGGAGFGVAACPEQKHPELFRTSKHKPGAASHDSSQTRTALHRLCTGYLRFPLAGRYSLGAKSENTIQEGLKEKD